MMLAFLKRLREKLCDEMKNNVLQFDGDFCSSANLLPLGFASGVTFRQPNRYARVIKVSSVYLGQTNSAAVYKIFEK